MPCTLNAFLKMYSSNTTALEWTDDDIDAMHAEIENVLGWSDDAEKESVLK